MTVWSRLCLKDGMAAVSKNVLIRRARALYLILATPRPPWVVGGGHMIASDGFSYKSAYRHYFIELFMAIMSAILRSTDPHLNHTLDNT